VSAGVRRLLLLALVPGLLLPALGTAAADPPPAVAPVSVPPAVVQLDVAGVDADAAAEPPGGPPAVRLGGTARRTVLLTARRPTARFGLLGVTWDRTAGPGALEVWARTRTAGTWSGWTPLGGVADEEPDADEAAGSRSGTAPLWVGAADGVQVRADVLAGPSPAGLRVALVDPGTSPADEQAAEAPLVAARADAPPIRSRAAWGADESLRSGQPSYAASVAAVVVHHTASSNDYAPADVPALLRGFYAYHVQGRGWSDLAYNVLVDRFGTAWEGRAGGLGRAVIGAHAGGFNTGTLGVAMIGTHETTAPTPAVLETLARVVAWKTGAAGVDPQGRVRLTSGGSTRFPAGTVVTLPTVLGHREVSTTACPGLQGSAALAGVRARAAALGRGAPPVLPGLSLVVPSSATAGSEAEVVVRAGRPGAAVQVFTAARGAEGAFARRSGVLSAAGRFRTSVRIDDDTSVFAVVGDRATPRATVRRVPALSAEPRVLPARLRVTGPGTALTGTRVPVTATGPPGAAVSLWVRAEGAPAFVRSRSGRFGADGRFALTYVARRATTYLATSGPYASPEGTTGLGPVPNELDVTAPPAVTAGRRVAVAVQGRPGAPVALWFAREGEASFVRRRVGVLAADGMYRTSYVATAQQTYFATSGSRSSTRRTTRTTAPPPESRPSAPRLRLVVPSAVDAGAPVPVEVVGPARAGVELWTRRRERPPGRARARARWARTAAGGRPTPASTTTSCGRPPSARPPRRCGRWRCRCSPRRPARRWAPACGSSDGPGPATPSSWRPAGGGPAPSSARRSARTGRAPSPSPTGSTTSTSTGPRAPGGPARRTGPRSPPPAPGPRPPSAARSSPCGGRPVRAATCRCCSAPRTAGRARLPAAGFAVRREVRADATGHWRTSFVLSSRHSWFARSDGAASPVRTTAAR
jgi:hypothetical protein